MGIPEYGIKATESRIFVLNQFDTYPNIDLKEFVQICSPLLPMWAACKEV